MRNLILGAVAGAAGTIALDMVTYGDMVLRGRPASETPAKVAGILADKAQLDLQAGQGKEEAENRKSGLGALIGYGTGVGVGAVFGLLAPALTRVLPGPLLAVAVGAAAMAASDTPIAKLGVSDPAEWSASDWGADLIPHLAYGFVTVATYNAFAKRGN